MTLGHIESNHINHLTASLCNAPTFGIGAHFFLAFFPENLLYFNKNKTRIS